MARVAGRSRWQLLLHGPAGSALPLPPEAELRALLPASVSLTIDPRILADWKNGGWTMPAGEYTFALGKDAETLGTPVKVRLPAKTWKD